MTDTQFNDMMSMMREILSELRGLRESQHPNPQQEEVYGIKPEAIYSQRDVEEMFSRCSKTIRKWRQEYGLVAHQEVPEANGSDLWYLGQDLIDFFRVYAVRLSINHPKKINKTVPKGHL